NSLFIGALGNQNLIRLTVDGNRVVEKERLLVDRKRRIRDVRQGPDGYVYVLTDASPGEFALHRRAGQSEPYPPDRRRQSRGREGAAAGRP
ncbi:hypothetical protein CTI14_64495, partial [Methylobacterium radiotolerans]